MKKKILLRAFAAFAFLAVAFAQIGYSQCAELGTNVSQSNPILKNPIGFCPGIAQAASICDCPPGFVAVGYEGTEGNVYGPMVLSQFKLRCKQLNSDGTLGASVSVTCDNGNVAGNNPDGPVDAAANEVLVGAEVRIGCAADAIMGESISVANILAGTAYSAATTNGMTAIGGTGGAPQPVIYVPNGSVIVGMQTFIDPVNQPNGALGLSAGVAWRHASINNVMCPGGMCSVDAISVANISACNDNGTPSTADDTFTADVTVTFTDAPAAGSLNLSGDGTGTVTVGSLGAGTYTFTGVSMSADGGPISLSATFSDDAACTLTNANAGTAPSACSVAPPSACSITSISASNISACSDGGTPSLSGDDTFTADITVAFASPPATGSLVLSGDAIEFVAVGSLGAGTYTFTGVSMSADGTPINITAQFNSEPACTLTNANAGQAPAGCSAAPATIPTMSQWGLILFSLIIFTLSVVFGTQQQRALATGGNVGSQASGSWKLPFEKSSFFKVLPLVYLGFVAVFASAIAIFGYEMTSADIPGSLLSGLVIAYLAQFVMNSNDRKN